MVRSLYAKGASGTDPLPKRHPMAAPVLSKEAWATMSDEALKYDSFTAAISLLGSTGSIGTQTLDIVRARPDKFKVRVARAYMCKHDPRRCLPRCTCTACALTRFLATPC